MSQRARGVVIPGGVVLTRRHVRRRGGFVGIGVALALFCAGWILKTILGGTLSNVASFVATMVAFPVMPILGIPASGGSSRILLAVVISLALWWFLGQLSSVKVSSRPVVGWREWSREFAFFAISIITGTIGAVVLAAYFLGLL
jgi:hypothetical protein